MFCAKAPTGKSIPTEKTVSNFILINPSPISFYAAELGSPPWLKRYLEPNRLWNGGLLP
jgi:hypothetical protein